MDMQEIGKKEVSPKRKLYYALFFPGILTVLIVLTFVFERTMELDFKAGGIFPRDPKTIPHIFFMPFIHSDWEHLVGNVLSFFVLGLCLFYFYGEIAGRVLLFSVIGTGVLLWFIGRDAWHIGLSGVVYALSFFLFFSGILRKYIPLIAISLMVVFIYGNHVWYLFPWRETEPVSWEGHLAGAIIGTLFALIYRNKGTNKPEIIWDEDDNEDEHAPWKVANDDE